MRSIGQLYHQYVGKKCMIAVLRQPARKAYKKYPARGRTPGVLSPFVIQDVRINWGREEVLVTPHNGTGSTWVYGSKCKIVEKYPDDKSHTLDGQE